MQGNEKGLEEPFDQSSKSLQTIELVKKIPSYPKIDKNEKNADSAQEQIDSISSESSESEILESDGPGPELNGTTTKSAKKQQSSRKRLIRKFIFIALLDGLFMLFEILGAYFSSSIVILTDAVDLLSDIFAHMISLISLYIGAQAANQELSYGYSRADLLGGLGSVCMIWVLAGHLIYESIQKLYRHQYDIQASVMFATSTMRFFANIVLMMVLKDCFTC